METQVFEYRMKDSDGCGCTLKIRPVTEADLSGIVSLEQACFPDPWNERMLRGSMDSRAETMFAAELTGKAEGLPAAELTGTAEKLPDGRNVDPAEPLLAGYMSLMHAADEGELLRIAVDPSCRRRGIADRMMETMDSWALAQGIVSIFLEVRSKNEGAIALYEKHGFLNLGLRKNYYHDPADHACIMKKEG